MGIPRKKYILVLAASAAVFLLLCAAAALLSRGAGADSSWSGEHPLRISECMTSNTRCPNADGVLCDWIEIANTSDRDFNVSGYRLSDTLTEAKYAFPVGTVIPAGGYIVVSCDPERTGALYAPFALRRKGGETLVLMNPANTVLDRVETLRGTRNYSQIRLEDGSLTVSNEPTPGFANTEAGYEAYLLSLGAGTADIRLSEIMSADTLIAAPDGTARDWIELRNVSDAPVSLAGWHLSDKEGETRFTFPDDMVLAAGGYAVVWCDPDGTEAGYAPFGLAKSGGETVVLVNAQNTAVDRVTLPALGDDEAYARGESGWEATRRATPGYANTDEGYAAWLAALGYADLRVGITGVMTRNKTGLTDGDGDHSDWIELTNSGGAAVSLEGWYLSDDPEAPTKWRFPAVTLAPGEKLVVFASGKDRTGEELHTNFALSAGETVLLSTPLGTEASAVECPRLEKDHAWVLGADGVWADAASPAPGGE